MILRNKFTGEIPYKIDAIAYEEWTKRIRMVYVTNDGERIIEFYDSLEEFNSEWEDK